MGDIFSKFLYSHCFDKKKRGHQEYKEVQEYSFIGGVDFSRDNQYVFPASSGFKRIDTNKIPPLRLSD